MDFLLIQEVASGAAGALLFGMATLLSTRNVGSLLVFRVIPGILGVMNIIVCLKLMGVL